MNYGYKQKVYDVCDLLTVEGQISMLLIEGDRPAGHLYSSVKASQPTISRRIARMIDQGMLEQRVSSEDRRVPIFSLSEKYKHFLMNTQIARVLSPSFLLTAQCEGQLIERGPA